MIPRLKAALPALLAMVVGGMVHANVRAASGLRLLPLRNGDGGLRALSVSDEAAAALTAERSARIEFLIGSLAPVVFVGVDGAEVRFNTFYRPQKWIVRILLENAAAGFVATRNGRFTDNLVVFHSSQWSAGGVNVGAGTAPATFEFSRNWWYCLDAPTRSRPTLPVTETGGTYGISPQLRDGEAGDLRLQPGSPASRVGADALPE